MHMTLLSLLPVLLLSANINEVSWLDDDTVKVRMSGQAETVTLAEGRTIFYMRKAAEQACGDKGSPRLSGETFLERSYRAGDDWEVVVVAIYDCKK